MKQMNIKRIALCAIALLTAGMASATTETYDFTGFTNNTITTADTESKGKVNGQNINLLQIGTETFNNRFAVSRVGGAAGGAWVAKNWNDQKGLFTSYNDRYFTILGLNDGDKVTITWSTDNAGTLKFFDAPAITGKSAGDAVESGTTYTISTSEDAVNVNLFADGSGTATALYIKSVVIETPVSSETIYIGQTMDTYNLEAITGSIDDNNPVTIGGTAYSRFSTERKDLFQVSGEGWGWQVNYNKWFAINDLKAGDKVWIKYTKSDGQTVAFGDATQIGETGTVELESEKWYTLAKNADQLKLVNQVNTNGLKANYKEIRIISTDNSILQSTLVSANGLDFSGLSAKAYVATKAAGGVVTFQQVNKVAPNTPVYLKADAAGAVEVPIIDGGYDDVTTNLLKGSASA
ncbi:MAG: hypothetical protein IJ637_04455, partial [Prevotella sp.]|nr:hypothetical protein [Prevotella sp.]